MKKIILIFLFTVVSNHAQVTEEWVAKITNMVPTAMVVDEDENIIITGNLYSVTSHYDYATIKYNSAGSQQWLVTYSFNTGSNSQDYAHAIAVDSLGNVYVTGKSWGADTTRWDWATIKYNAVGVEQWVRRYDGPTNYDDDEAYSIAADEQGDVYVTGYTSAGIRTIKYSSSGALLWSELLPAAFSWTGLVLDASANVYITSAKYGSGSLDYVTIKYNSSGVQQWQRTYNGPGNGQDYPTSITIDETGNIYVTGLSRGVGSGDDYATIKYNSSGVEEWAARYTGPGNKNDQASSIVVNSAGDVYVTGYTIIGSLALYGTVKYNSQGIQQWQALHSSPDSISNSGRDIVLDESNNVYVTGYGWGSATSSDYYTVKYNPNGVEQWVHSYIRPAGDRAHFIASSKNNIYVTGESSEIGNLNGTCATIKYSQSSGLNITSPVAGEKWIAGETDTIRWTGGPDTVDIFISLDYENGNGTFLPVMYNYFSPDRFFAIDIPNNILSSKSVIRIQSSLDSTQRVESGVFRIKGYVLTRIRTDGSYEAFEPDEDGWSFQNISDNMWPPLWWVLINYQTGLDPYTGSVYPQEEFANMHSYNFPDWSLFVEAFTVQKCYLSTGPSPVYKPSAILRWKDFVSFNWNGSCAGFSVSSLLVFCFEEDFLNQFPIGTYLNLFDLPLDNFRRLVINQLQNYFIGTEHLNYALLQSDKTPRQTLAELKELLIGDEVDGRYLNLDNGSKAHAVVPYRLVKETSSQGVYYAEIYDCNHPGTIQSVVIDSAANYWDYGSLGWGGNQGCYLMDPVSTYLQHPTLSPFAANSFVLSGSTQDYFQIYNTIGANIVLSDSSGNSIGIQDSVIINTLPNGIPIIPITSLYQPPIGYYVLNGRYTAQITSFTDSISHLSIYSDSLILNFQRGDATQDQTDELFFDMSGMSLFNPDLQTKSCSFKTIVLESEVEKVIDILNYGIEQSDSVNFNVMNHDQFKLINWGSGKTYDLKLHIASVVGQSRFLHSGISIPMNSSAEIIPSWNDLEQPVVIFLDLGNNGTIDDTLEVENQYGTTTTFQLAVTINNGWNMVSVPGLHPTNQNVNTWWSGKDPAAGVFRYSGGYQSITDASPGTGYWMKHLGTNTYNTGEEWPAGGIQLVAHNPLNGQAGWNLIGGYEETVATAGITTNPPGLITGPIYKYSGGYQAASDLIPGYGYWVKLNSAGEINIPGALSKGNNSAKEYFEDKWGKIIITDAAGMSYTLYAITGNVDLIQYELPPAPPAGMFDIRFSSGRIAEDINSSVQSILFSGIEHPFTLRAENIDIKLQDESGIQINAILKSGEEIVINDVTINKLMVSGELVPVKYELEQNYPNPFNPTTTIKYSIAKQSDVTLKVYDMLGSEIATLVNEEKPAGVYEINFNASNLASGIYFYKIQAGSFVETKKMILLK